MKTRPGCGMELAGEFARSPAAKRRKKDSVNDGKQSFLKHEVNHFDGSDGKCNRFTDDQLQTLAWCCEYTSSPALDRMPASGASSPARELEACGGPTPSLATSAASSYSSSILSIITNGEFTFYSVINL